MNLATLHLPKDVARAKLKAVRAALHKRADEKYRDLEKVYHAVAEGLAILDLARTMRMAPAFPDGMPKLAIARADRAEILCTRRHESVEFDTTKRNTWTPGTLTIRVEGMPRTEKWIEGRTPVPGIPPEVRTRMKGKPSEHFVLWEVEAWTMEPDRDPMLLRHLSGHFFAILDHWELSKSRPRF